MRMTKGLLILLLTAFFALTGTRAMMAQDVPSKLLVYPEIILHNGKVLTVDEQFSIVQAVAIRDGRFLEVGTNRNVLALKGPDTTVIDMNGRTVVPGFFDPHLHGAWRGNISKRGVRNLRFKTLEEGLAAIKEEMPNHTAGEWVVFTGLRNNIAVNQLTRWDLDTVSPDHPIRIMLDTALSVVNTKAWELIRHKIERMPGIMKDPIRGEPNGHVRGQANGVLLYEDIVWPEDWETRLVEEQKDVFRRLNSQGLTTVIGRAQGLSISILHKLWENDELTIRVRPSTEFVMYNPEADAYLKRLGNLTGFGDEWFKIIGLTVGPPDGIGTVGGLLARMPRRRDAEVAGGPAWDMRGENKWALGTQDGDYTNGTEYGTILLANQYGWSVQSVHAQGDLAAKMMLDALEEANEDRSTLGRNFGFDHGVIRTKEDMERALKMGIIMSFAPKYLFRDSPVQLSYQFGEEILRFTPVKSALALGLKPVLESDVAGDYSASLWNIEALVTRRDENGNVWGAQEAISREDALRMRTAWAARYSGDEDVMGTIEEGKYGDLVVLGGDYLTVEPDQIAEIPIDFTIVGGKIMYDRSIDGLIKSEIWDRRGFFSNSTDTR
ncbi:MAG: amidohydrolase family protein [Acidobacteria bacterium]|nr:amidohydrolase family protein [Acidobacteriota bacterium]